MMLWVFWSGCAKPESKSVEDDVQIELIAEHTEGKMPKFRIEHVQQKHLDVILSAYKELEAYHGVELSKDVEQIRFVGQDFPWKPITEKHYCIDVREQESTEKEHVYKFANYCRSVSTLLRETNEILNSYINIQTCEDVCACVDAKELSMFRSLSCLDFCKPKGVELTCESNKTLKKQCCM